MYGVNGMSPPWLPISETPRATARAAVSMLPAVSVFLGLLCLDWAARRRLAALILAFGLASVLVAIVQRMGGSPAAGAFANKNHQAALLYSLLPFSFALLYNSSGLGALPPHNAPTGGQSKLAAPRRRGARGAASRIFSIALRREEPKRTKHRRVEKDYRRVLAGIMASMSFLILWLGIMMATSRLGVLLGIVSSLAALWLLPRARADAVRRGPALLGVVLFSGLLLLLLVPFGLADLAEYWQARAVSNDLRWQINRIAWVAAMDFFPVGSGIKSFEPVIQLFERPHELFDELINNAHNDWLELFLEGGIPAGLIMGAWLFWLTRKTFSSKDSSKDERVDRLASAALITLWLLAIHSLGDYPLRTTALSTLFAFSCGLLCRAPCAHPTRHSQSIFERLLLGRVVATYLRRFLGARPSAQLTRPTHRPSRRRAPAGKVLDTLGLHGPTRS